MLAATEERIRRGLGSVHCHERAERGKQLLGSINILTTLTTDAFAQQILQSALGLLQLVLELGKLGIHVLPGLGGEGFVSLLIRLFFELGNWVKECLPLAANVPELRCNRLHAFDDLLVCQTELGVTVATPQPAGEDRTLCRVERHVAARLDAGGDDEQDVVAGGTGGLEVIDCLHDRGLHHLVAPWVVGKPWHRLIVHGALGDDGVHILPPVLQFLK